MLQKCFTTNAFRCNVLNLPVTPSCCLCGRHDETIDHLISGCEVIAKRLYKCCCDEVARMLHRELAKSEGFEVVRNGGTKNRNQVLYV